MFGGDVSMSVSSPETNNFFELREYVNQISEKKG